ncbi:unnamed protein product [Oppiella nova]|uniref:Uncharacterized protein n=1 Tax=Oppiella nova TaxID=334625 RepID=A0A7R9QT48_9ACAR|nr:unnamed protein product [Oppiella nova]CAG2172992.1 unnamed protein product [Oppiella nova]
MSDNNIITLGKPYDEIPNISVGELFSKALRQLDPEFICAIDANTDTKLTANELITKCNALAMALIERGITESDLILTFAENTIELVVVLFTAVLLGVTLYPITPIANVYELEKLFETLNSVVVFTSQSKSQIINKILGNNTSKSNVKSVFIIDGTFDNYVTFDELLKEGLNKNLPQIPYFEVKDPEKEIFLILQSSGTTGVPKSTLLSHKAFVASIYSMINSGMNFDEFAEHPKFGHITPFGCITGMTFLYGYICCGVSVVTFRHYNEELIMKSIEKYKINFIMIVPAFGPLLVSGPLVDKYDLSSLGFVYTGGAHFPECTAKAIIAKYGVKFQEVYGMTEYCGTLTHVPDLEVCGQYIAGNLGRPAKNTQMKIRDLTTGESLGPNIDGEICVRGPKLFSGYLNNPLATKEAIDSEGWLRTGDMGHYDEKHRFFITDRLKELIKFGTKQVSPTEVEQFLLTHKCVAEVAVVGVRHETQSQWVRAYVKVRDGMTVTEEELKKYVSDNLNDAKLLRAGVVFVDRIPRTTVGKVDRRYFKQLIADQIIKSNSFDN